MKHTIADTVRWCADIGCWTIDRPISLSCTHATPFCLGVGNKDGACFNFKLYGAFGHAMHPKDKRNETAWQAITADHVAAMRAKFRRAKTKQWQRIRLMSRGEAFSNLHDIQRVKLIAKGLPESLIWIPTRAWHNPLLWVAVRTLMASHDNLRVLASLDPSDSPSDIFELERDGISTMYFGDDTQTSLPSGTRQFRCPKTWSHIKGICGGVCKRGCFNNTKPVHIHLKEH